MSNIRRIKISLFLVVCVVVPVSVCAQATSFSITTSPQTIAPNAVSEAITVSAESAVGQTTCILLSSSSGTGQFSSSASNWSSVSAVTMSKNTTNRTFYYKDSASGSYTLSVRIAPKPESVSASCASWEDAQAAVQNTATQTITIGTSQTQTPPQSDATTTTPVVQSQTSNNTVSSYVPPPQPQIFAYAGKDRDVISGADITFEGIAYDRKGAMLDTTTVRFVWNFGDGARAEGSSVKHHFVVPGRYAVILDIAQALSSASHRIIVTAQPVSISVSVRDGRHIALRNTSGRDLDLSDWFLRTGTGMFRLPPHTTLLSDTEVMFPQEITRLAISSKDDVALLYPNGTVAALAGAPVVTALPTAIQEEAFHVSSVVPEKHKETNTAQISTQSEPDDEPVMSADDTYFATSSVAAAAASGISLPWGVAAILVACAGAVFVWFIRRSTVGQWRIIEES